MPAPRRKPSYAELEARLRIHEKLVANLLAEREQLHQDQQVEWRALGSCNFEPYHYNTALGWCEAGLIDARKPYGRWEVRISPERLAGAKPTLSEFLALKGWPQRQA